MHGVPEKMDFGILVTFVGSKVSQFLMCVVHDLIPDIQTIAKRGRGNVVAISISFPFPIKNSTQNLAVAFILSIAVPWNCMAVQWVL
jgi:hypothetical protein